MCCTKNHLGNCKKLIPFSTKRLKTRIKQDKHIKNIQWIYTVFLLVNTTRRKRGRGQRKEKKVT